MTKERFIPLRNSEIWLLSLGKAKFVALFTVVWPVIAIAAILLRDLIEALVTDRSFDQIFDQVHVIVVMATPLIGFLASFLIWKLLKFRADRAGFEIPGN
ncbi:MAG: hypothetical protein V3W18_12210 [candidate division Zixibacteria bacterium]